MPWVKTKCRFGRRVGERTNPAAFIGQNKDKGCKSLSATAKNSLFGTAPLVAVVVPANIGQFSAFTTQTTRIICIPRHKYHPRGVAGSANNQNKRNARICKIRYGSSYRNGEHTAPGVHRRIRSAWLPDAAKTKKSSALYKKTNQSSAVLYKKNNLLQNCPDSNLGASSVPLPTQPWRNRNDTILVYFLEHKHLNKGRGSETTRNTYAPTGNNTEISSTDTSPLRQLSRSHLLPK